ncbi:MAG: ubiquinol-cytochrome c reductase [Candidatus Binatia bacterium]|nr:MAG: ubiquinol-cytochrome c reductase [Candidatus Binatia bacterium]
MGHWLLKTEPDTYSFSDLQREGRTTWDGVTNPQALGFLRQIQPGDEVFIYHTGKEKAVVGIGRCTRAAYRDPRSDDPRLVVIDLVAVRPLPRAIRLAEIKKRAEWTSWELVRLPRLSVMPVPENVWLGILELSEKK